MKESFLVAFMRAHPPSAEASRAAWLRMLAPRREESALERLMRERRAAKPPDDRIVPVKQDLVGLGKLLAAGGRKPSLDHLLAP